jgi:hypothetical protein
MVTGSAFVAGATFVVFDGGGSVDATVSSSSELTFVLPTGAGVDRFVSASAVV